MIKSGVQVTASHLSKIGELVKENLDGLEDGEASAQIRKHFENTVAYINAQKGKCMCSAVIAQLATDVKQRRKRLGLVE